MEMVLKREILFRGKNSSQKTMNLMARKEKAKGKFYKLKAQV
jgi:hypothetical protein